MLFKEIFWNDSKFIFVYPQACNEFVEFVDKNKDEIFNTIQKEFGKFLFDKVYVIIDDWGISIASFPTNNKKIALILLNYKDESKVRENKKLLFYFVHELCHLTEKGNFPFKKTPEQIHKKFDDVARKVLENLRLF